MLFKTSFFNRSTKRKRKKKRLSSIVQLNENEKRKDISQYMLT